MGRGIPKTKLMNSVTNTHMAGSVTAKKVATKQVPRLSLAGIPQAPTFQMQQLHRIRKPVALDTPAPGSKRPRVPSLKAAQTKSRRMIHLAV